MSEYEPDNEDSEHEEVPTDKCPHCGYESAPVVPAQFPFEGGPPGRHLLAIIPVADCPICLKQTPLIDPEEARNAMLKQMSEAREKQEAFEKKMREGSASVKRAYEGHAIGLLGAGVLIGYGGLRALDVLFAPHRSPKFWTSLTLAIIWGSLGVFMTLLHLKRMREFSCRLTIHYYEVTDAPPKKKWFGFRRAAIAKAN